MAQVFNNRFAVPQKRGMKSARFAAKLGNLFHGRFEMQRFRKRRKKQASNPRPLIKGESSL